MDRDDVEKLSLRFGVAEFFDSLDLVQQGCS